jgi:hypothetical protein
VISGEHGIGITKLEFLTDEELQPFTDYKLRVDPQGRFNKGKLLRNSEQSPKSSLGLEAADLTNAYTPSFGLMGHESLIMQQSRHRRHCRQRQGLPALRQVQAGVRHPCAACQPAVQPAQQDPGHFAAGRGLPCTKSRRAAASAIKHWEEFEDVADHCTVCHKCLSPCPVDIDFGDVSMNMRNLLRKMGRSRSARRRAAAMFFLNAPIPQPSSWAHPDGGWGFKAQRLANHVLKPGRKQTKANRPPRWAPAPIKEQVIHFINKKMPGGLPKKTARALLDIEDKDYVPIIRNPKVTTAETEAVFYFPGLRLRAPVQPGGPGHPGHAVACRCANRAAAGLPVLRLPAARQRPV